MDRDIFLFEKMGEIYDNKISFMIESLDNQLKINMLEAQYKVVTESGTKEDFEYLYMEAQEETKEKKKGIFNGIIEWVKKIKDKIVDFFTKKKIEKRIKEMPDKFEVDESYNKKFSFFKKFHEWLVRPINLIKAKNYKGLVNDLISKGSGIVAACCGIVLVGQHVSMNKDKFKESADWILKYFKTDCDTLIKLLKIDDSDSGIMKFLKQMVGFINKMVTQSLDWIMNIAFHVVKGPVAVTDKLMYSAYRDYRDQKGEYERRYDREREKGKLGKDDVDWGMQHLYRPNRIPKEEWNK